MSFMMGICENQKYDALQKIIRTALGVIAAAAAVEKLFAVNVTCNV